MSKPPEDGGSKGGKASALSGWRNDDAPMLCSDRTEGKAVVGGKSEALPNDKKKKTLFTYLKRGEGREKERERNINVWLPLTRLPTGDLARNPGMYPDWESNQ